MKENKILIVEDQFIEADYLRLLLINAGYAVCDLARSVVQAEEIIKRQNPDFVLLDIFLKGKQTGIDLAVQLQQQNIPFVYLSANSNEEILALAKKTQPYGFLVKPFREKDLLITLEIARYRHKESQEAKWRIEMKMQKELEDIKKTEGNWINKLVRTAITLQHYVPFDVFAIKFKPQGQEHFVGFAFVRIGFEEYQAIGLPELSVMSGLTATEIKDILRKTPNDNGAGYYNGDDFKKIAAIHPMKNLFARQFDLSSNLVFPFQMPGKDIFTLSFFRKIPDGYNSEKLDWLFRFQEPLGEIMSSVSDEEKGTILSTIEKPNLVLSGTVVPAKGDFENIVGNSFAMLTVMDQINQVAPFDTSVLILGESGTGKERIADSIYNRSARKGKPFIKVNCAALPLTLIDSELFGHEKGAFTGAIDRKIGKFEQADGGSIFLDEVGELPLELQAKLLRVLQEKEIQRLGSVATIKLNIRFIAATNRNLEKEVAAGKFRLDLYYRLNVFPITLPPLRERLDDLPALTAHFIEYFSRKTAKNIKGVSEKTAHKFAGYHWPGNIRELEHLIERSVLLSKGNIIDDIMLPEVETKQSSQPEHDIKTIQEMERDHILSVLRKCNGKIWGPGAAAEVLKIPPSTLKSKMKKLGITRAY
jgi:DNA-binding NtrC family response regulator